jgi:hypothetical protein
VTECFELQFDQNVALQNSVIADQVDDAARVADQDPLLPRFEARRVIGKRKSER